MVCYCDVGHGFGGGDSGRFYEGCGHHGSRGGGVGKVVIVVVMLWVEVIVVVGVFLWH